MSAVYVEKGITLKQNQFEELKRRGNDVNGLVERTDARGDRGNNGDSEGNDKLKKSGCNVPVKTFGCRQVKGPSRYHYFF